MPRRALPPATEVLRPTFLVLAAGIVTVLILRLADAALHTLSSFLPKLGIQAIPALPDLFLSPAQALGAAAIWILLAAGLGFWPWVLGLGRVVAEGIVYVLGALIGSQIHAAILALWQGRAAGSLLRAEGREAGILFVAAIAVMWLPEVCQALPIPAWLRVFVLVIVLGAAGAAYRL